MQLLPSISVIKGRTARLKQGDYSSEKIYDVSPIDVATQFEDHGIRQIHLIDLDGARRGAPKNYDTLQLIRGYCNLEVNFAGGVQTDGDVGKAFEYGANSVTAATVSVINQDLFSDWLMSYGREKIMLSADVENGFLKVGGWQKETKRRLIEHVGHFYDRGLKYLKSTEISKDGILEGPAFDLYQEIMREYSGICIYASGGIRSIDDIKALQDMGVYGAIFGRAFYEGKITLEDIEAFVR